MDSDNLLDTTTEALVQQVHASSSPSSRSSSSDSVLLKFPHADMHARAAHVHTRAHASGDVDHSSQVLNNVSEGWNGGVEGGENGGRDMNIYVSG